MENYIIYELVRNKKLIDLYLDMQNNISVEYADKKFLDELERLKKIGLTDEIVQKAISIKLKKIMGFKK